MQPRTPHGPESSLPPERTATQVTAAAIAFFRRELADLAVVGALAAAAFIGVSLALPHRYEATARLTTESGTAGSLPAGILGITAQLGVTLPGGQLGPAFFRDIVSSRMVLDSVLLTPFPDELRRATESDALLDYYRPDASNRGEQLERARRVLLGRLSSHLDLESGIMEVRVSDTDPRVALWITERALSELNGFNVNTRQSQARERRQFLEARARDVGSLLEQAEDSLAAFLIANRSYQSSPELRFAYDRLQRRVDLHQQVYTSLLQELEQARLDEIRDIPVITVIDPPQLPYRPAWPRWSIIVLGVMFGAPATAVGFVAIREFLRQARRSLSP